MISARIAEALANQRRLYGRTAPEWLADIRRGSVVIDRLLSQGEAGGDLGEILEAIARQAGGLQQAALKGAAAARAIASQGGGK